MFWINNLYLHFNQSPGPPEWQMMTSESLWWLHVWVSELLAHLPTWVEALCGVQVPACVSQVTNSTKTRNREKLRRGNPFNLSSSHLNTIYWHLTVNTWRSVKKRRKCWQSLPKSTETEPKKEEKVPNLLDQIPSPRLEPTGLLLPTWNRNIT